MKKFLKNNFLLLMVILLGLVLRAWGIGYNFPLSSSVGDEVRLISGSLKMLSDHSLLPVSEHGVYFPLMYYFYALGAILYSAGLFVFGLAHNIADLKNSAMVSLGQWVIIGRIISLIMGTASVYLAYLIAQRLWNKKTISLLVALFFALSPLNVAVSHFGKIWTPQVFFVILSIYLCLLFWQDPLKKVSKLKILFTAIIILASFSVNLIGIISYPAFLLVLFFYYCEASFKKFFKFIFSPRSIIFHIILILGFLIVVLAMKDSWITYGAGFKIFLNPSPEVSEGNFLWQGSVWERTGLTFNLLLQFETVIFLLFIPGLYLLARQKKKEFWFLLLLTLGFFLAVSPPLLQSTRPRYLTLLIPILTFPAAYFSGWIAENLKKKKIILIVFILALMAPALFIDIKYDMLLQKGSTKLDLYNWVLNSLPKGKKALLVGDYLLQDITPSRELTSLIKQYSPEYYSSRLEYLDNNPSLNDGVDLYSDGFFCSWPAEVAEKIKFDYLIIMEKDGYSLNLKNFEICGRIFTNDLDEKELILREDTSPYFLFSIDSGIPLESYGPLSQIRKIGPRLSIYKL